MVFHLGIDHHHHNAKEVIALATIKGRSDIADQVIAASAAGKRIAIETLRSDKTTHILIGQPKGRFNNSVDFTKPITTFSFKSET